MQRSSSKLDYILPMLFGLLIIVVMVLSMTGTLTGELKKNEFIVPDWIHTIPTPTGSARGGELMYEIEDLGVPGWKYGNCCTGARLSAGHSSPS